MTEFQTDPYARKDWPDKDRDDVARWTGVEAEDEPGTDCSGSPATYQRVRLYGELKQGGEIAVTLHSGEHWQATINRVVADAEAIYIPSHIETREEKARLDPNGP